MNLVSIAVVWLMFGALAGWFLRIAATARDVVAIGQEHEKIDDRNAVAHRLMARAMEADRDLGLVQREAESRAIEELAGSLLRQVAFAREEMRGPRWCAPFPQESSCTPIEVAIRALQIAVPSIP